MPGIQHRNHRLHASGAALLLAFVLSALLSLAATPVRAQVFKCRTPEGLSYQDKPCPPGTEQPAPHIAPPPAYVPPPPESAPAADSVRETAPPLERRPPPPPLPTQYRCSDAVGGKSYVSASPNTQVRYVPLWTVMPGGTSSGGLSADLPTQDRLPATALGSYTPVQDRCRPMPVGELCAHWRQRLDEVGPARRRAFNDTRPQLEQEEAGLEDQLAYHCQG